MQNKMNMKNEMHKCVPRSRQINLSAQEFEYRIYPHKAFSYGLCGGFLFLAWDKRGHLSAILPIIKCSGF